MCRQFVRADARTRTADPFITRDGHGGMWGELSASLSEISVAGIGETPLYPHTQLANTRQS